MAHLQGGVIVDERCLQLVDSHPVDAALFAVELDPVQVDHSGEDGQLHVALQDGGQQVTATASLDLRSSSSAQLEAGEYSSGGCSDDLSVSQISTSVDQRWLL